MFFKVIKNKYVLSFILFSFWMCFIDKDDLASQHRLDVQLEQLEHEKQYYLAETQHLRQDLADLSSNPAKLEKFARERYLMKKDNEDLYVIVHEKTVRLSLFKKFKSLF